MTRRFRLLIICLIISPVFSGCASYRASSNVETSNFTASSLQSVGIFEAGNKPNDKYTTSQLIKVSVKKLTVFHDDPTKEQANAELQKRAGALDCDAVVNVAYKTGIGFTTWGYIDAQGYCAVFD